jgi:hypothetical protein
MPHGQVQKTTSFEHVSFLTFQNSVTDLQPSDTEENPYFYTFKVQCSSCRETHPNWVSFNRFVSYCLDDMHEVMLVYGNSSTFDF